MPCFKEILYMNKSKGKKNTSKYTVYTQLDQEVKAALYNTWFWYTNMTGRALVQKWCYSL